ncbi:MAG: sigma-54 dependent transcriptional regulator [Ignavibacteria bacterium]|nr:sigma-54 dependent transcriptional regulator [Ignavibacteria bacterium]
MKSDPRSFQEEHGIIGSSVEMQKIIEVVEQVAPTDITVLISGESGVGKEIIAKAIHNASQRSHIPLITVNSGAIPEGIIESELFGHERGSFTGASEKRKGYFELVDGGTIFLDEIGEIPLSSQVKFLRVLENGEFLRVGSSIPRKVDVRVIAATNKDLESEVRHGRFRADLFFRLRSVNITIPPLRNRPDDIPLFFQKFVDDFFEKKDVKFAGISEEAMQFLKSYHWPGNVRELRNVVESMLILESGKYIHTEDVRKYLKEYKPASDGRNLPVPISKSVEEAERELILRALLDIKVNILELRNQLAQGAHVIQGSDMLKKELMYFQDNVEEPVMSLQEMERKMIVEALGRSKGNRRVAARALNISERTLYRKIKEYSLG